MGKKHREGWNVVKSATQRHEVSAEVIIQKFVTDNYWEILRGAQNEDYDRADALKVCKAIKSARVMLIWQDEG